MHLKFLATNVQTTYLTLRLLAYLYQKKNPHFKLLYYVVTKYGIALILLIRQRHFFHCYALLNSRQLDRV